MPRPVVRLKADAIKRLPVAGSAYEFAKILGVDKKAVQRWISRDKMPAVRIKENYSVIRDEFLEWAKRTGRA